MICVTMASSRCTNIGEEAMTDLLDKKDSKSTAKTIKKGQKAFRDYLSENGIDTNFELLGKSDLNEHLRNFYACIKKKGKGANTDGGLYKINAFTNLKYGLARFIKSSMGYDIVDDVAFESSGQVYKAMLKKLAREGYGGTNHMVSISEEDLALLFSGTHHAFDVNTPVGLQQKVWFDIVFYLCRRGQENQRNMKKATYQVSTDASGRDFVYQAISEADKNHSGSRIRPEDTTGESRIYELPGNPACPVRAFEKFVSKLNPDLDDLWQRPLEQFVTESTCWYYRMPISIGNLAGFMTKISKSAGLSVAYTNHCIRSTHISILDENDFSVGQIMRSTGHKSESSIKSYANRLSDKKKRKISDALSTAVGLETPKPAAALGAPPPMLALPAPPAVAAVYAPPAVAALPAPPGVGALPGPSALVPAPMFPDAFDFQDIAPFSPTEMNDIDGILRDLSNTSTTNTHNTMDINTENRAFNFMPSINNCNISFNFYGPGPRM